MINYHSLVMYKRPGHIVDSLYGAWTVCIGPGHFALHYFADHSPILARRPYIVLLFFNSSLGYRFFYMAPVGDLGGAVDPEIGCVMHWVVVETTGACWDMRRLGIRRG